MEGTSHRSASARACLGLVALSPLLVWLATALAGRIGADERRVALAAALALAILGLLVVRRTRSMTRRERRAVPPRRPGGVELEPPTQAAMTEFPRSSIDLLTGVKDELIEQLRCRLAQQQADLCRLRRRARSSVLSRRDLLSGLSYETRTTLNAIIGLVRILGRSGLGAEQAHHVQTVREAAESLLMRLDSTLDLARLEIGVLELEERPFELDALLDEVLEIVGPRATAKGVELAAIVGAGVPRRLRGDQLRLRRVLLQLVSSGVSASSEGGVDVSVSSVPTGSGRARLTIEVRDAGPGLAEERAGGLFDLEDPAGGARQEGSAATGAELFVGRAIARRMGGDLSVESRPGEGSTFRLEVVACVRSEGSAPAPDARLAGRRVLVVDAREGARRAAREILIGLGVESQEAGDGSRALNALRAAAESGQSFDALLVGVDLVGLGGERLARKVLRNPAHAGTAVLLLAHGYGPMADALLREEGVSGWIRKPLRAEAVRAELLRALSLEPDPSSVTLAAPVVLDVLVAEDDPANRDVLALQLAELGASVDVACDGREALDAVGLKRYDLVLLDLRMPVLSGLAALRRIRAHADPRVAGIPVVGLTAGSLDEDLPRCREAGMDDLLQLPARPEDLTSLLARAGALSSDRAALERQGPGTREAAVDLAAIRALLLVEDDDEDGLLAEVVELFLADTPPRLEHLSAALAAEDWSEVEELSRGLRTSSAQVGARPLSCLCECLEESARGPRAAHRAARLVERLRAEFGRVREALTALAGE